MTFEFDDYPYLFEFEHTESPFERADKDELKPICSHYFYYWHFSSRKAALPSGFFTFLLAVPVTMFTANMMVCEAQCTEMNDGTTGQNFSASQSSKGNL